MNKVFIIAAALLLIGAAGCYNDKYDQLYVTPPNTVCDTTAVSYSATIAPIISANCNVSGGCHNTAGAGTSNYDFTTYAGLQSVANYNYIITDINQTPQARHHAMPLDLPKLPQCEIDQITAWVDQGALNN